MAFNSVRIIPGVFVVMVALSIGPPDTQRTVDIAFAPAATYASPANDCACLSFAELPFLSQETLLAG